MAVSSWSTIDGLNVVSGGVSGSGGADIAEGCAPSGINNAIRSIMAQLATYFTDANFTVTSTDAGASANPTITLYRNSATPAASDNIGRILFQGEDSAGNTEGYADILASISDSTSGSEDGALSFRNMVAGTLRATWSIGAGTATLTDFDAGAAAGPTFTLDRSSASPAASDITGAINFAGRDASGNPTTYASLYSTINDTTDASEDGGLGVQLMIAGALTTAAAWNSSTLRLWQDSVNNPGSGNNTVGIGLTSGGVAFLSSAGTALNINRTTDGNMVSFASGGTSQALISLSGATVTYGTFFGSHWAQLADGSKPDIPRGTIVECIDQMSVWPGEENPTLPCFKISDTGRSRRVYGVFAWWDDRDGGETNDALVGALGAFLIRMEAGTSVSGGDFIESAGNGCGRVQADDCMRSSTVAKVTSTQVIDHYPDGSFTVPCTLHCG